MMTVKVALNEEYVQIEVAKKKQKHKMNIALNLDLTKKPIKILKILMQTKLRFFITFLLVSH